MITNGDEPAFPTTESDNNGFLIQGFGLTKREQFAMAAMQSITFDNLTDSVKEEISKERAPGYLRNDPFSGIKEFHQSYGEEYVTWLLKAKSKYAVMQADALINALNEDNEKDHTTNH